MPLPRGSLQCDQAMRSSAFIPRPVRRPIHQRALEPRETLLCVECLHNETWKDTQQFLVGYKQRNRSMQAQLDGALLARVEIAGGLFQKWGLESHIHPFYQHRRTMWLNLLALTILSMRRIGQ
jgi:hypothetical protein